MPLQTAIVATAITINMIGRTAASFEYARKKEALAPRKSDITWKPDRSADDAEIIRT